MTPIIDPRLIYLIGFIDRALRIIIAGAALLSIALTVCGSLFFMSYSEDHCDPDEGIELRKRLPIRTLVIALVVCVLLLLLLPEKENMIAMLIAKYATVENMGAVIDAIKIAAHEISGMN